MMIRINSLLAICVSLGSGLVATSAEAAPPGDGWTLSFEDDFVGAALDSEKWTTEASPGWAGIESSRWPENLIVKDGYLAITTKKEQRGGKSWTTGRISSKSFKQQEGYFEVRMKINAANGIDNAFWLTSSAFEIDIAEVFFPNKIMTTLHDFKKKQDHSSSELINGKDLSSDFHVYGLLWESGKLTWYFDDNPIASQACSVCAAPAGLQVSSAVVKWERPHKGPDNTEMIVDWVRVFRH